MPQTGLGTTVGFSSDGAVGLIQTLQMPSWEIESIDFTNLDSTIWMKFLSGMTRNPGVANLTLYFDPTGDAPTMGIVQDMTITFPVFDPFSNGFSGTPGTLIGSGFINAIEFPNTAVNEPMLTSLSFQYDGINTPPAATPGSAPVEVQEFYAKMKDTPA